MIYLDSAATTRPSQSAIDAALKSFENFGNPSSLHKIGLEASNELALAREMIAKIIGAKPSEIYFTSSGTEANNLAIFSGAKKQNGHMIMTTPYEHPSVTAPLAKLKSTGSFEITNDQTTKEIALATLAHVNGETGEIRDIAAIAKQVKKNNPKALIHIDAAQSFCKLPINVVQMGIDMLTISAHKIGGLKGVGALFVRSGVNLAPVMLGGGQETGLRSGTENMPGIMAFAAAANNFWKCHVKNHAHAQTLKANFLETLNEIDGVTVNGENASPYILSISIEGIKAHVLLNALSAQGVCVSVGSACSTKKQHKDSGNTVRISFSPDTALDEVDKAKAIFLNCVESLKKLR